jgi:hypothetical protein
MKPGLPLMTSRRVAGLCGLVLLTGACGASADVAHTGSGAPLPATQGHQPAGLDVPAGYDPQGDLKPGQPLTPLNQRTAGPIAIRLFDTQQQNTQVACDPTNEECVPSWCVPQGSLIVELSNQAMVATREATVIGLASNSQMSVLNAEIAGVSENSPVQLAVVRVAADVARVQLSSSGGDDSAAPTNGFVALAVPGSGAGTLRALDKDGQSLQTAALAAGPTVNSAACQAAPIQPPKAGTPPADPKAAEASIREAFHTAYTSVPGASPYAGLERVEGGQGLHTALDQARNQFSEAANSMTVTTANLVFTSPTTAAVQYTLTYTGGAPWGTKYGQAVLVNGSWLVSRDTFCGLLAFGGGTCPKA